MRYFLVEGPQGCGRFVQPYRFMRRLLNDADSNILSQIFEALGPSPQDIRILPCPVYS